MKLSRLRRIPSIAAANSSGFVGICRMLSIMLGPFSCAFTTLVFHPHCVQLALHLRQLSTLLRFLQLNDATVQFVNHTLQCCVVIRWITARVIRFHPKPLRSRHLPQAHSLIDAMKTTRAKYSPQKKHSPGSPLGIIAARLHTSPTISAVSFSMRSLVASISSATFFPLFVVALVSAAGLAALQCLNHGVKLVRRVNRNDLNRHAFPFGRCFGVLTPDVARKPVIALLFAFVKGAALRLQRFDQLKCVNQCVGHVKHLACNVRQHFAVLALDAHVQSSLYGARYCAVSVLR
ncbi:capsid maturation protease [Xanthomonas phage Langgrundblatt1]|uniref:Capsid maturation protease n=1 Tax=Xanthomonas phage Langgrundblatt1 TaxID=2939128 RepID=A0A9E7J5G7_9CAUD|nr:capsid maturation protease [Xanthomonas phage Langgrundblatt1]URA06778.1 capsid maturation protease [Xanthomonas phage Langgrundblatt1]